MFPKAILLRTIIPDDDISKKSPRHYPKDTIIELTPLGYYVRESEYPLKGWLYKNIKKKEVHTNLVRGVDYKLI